MFTLSPSKTQGKRRKEVNVKPIDRRNIYFLIGIVFSLILILVAVTIATQRSSFFGRASGPSGGSALLSLENSYLFASPVQASADGESSIRVTAFIMNSQGLGVAGQKVTLKYSGGLTISEVQSVTDTFGRAMFDLSATTAASYTITGEVGGVSLPQTVSISFR